MRLYQFRILAGAFLQPNSCTSLFCFVAQPDPFSSAFGLSSAFNSNNASANNQLPGFATSSAIGQGGSGFGAFGSNSGFTGLGGLTSMQSKTNQLNNLLGSGTDRGAGTIGGGLGSSSLSQNPLIPQYNSSLSQGVFEVFVDVFDAYCLGVLISKSCFIHPTILLF